MRFRRISFTILGLIYLVLGAGVRILWGTFTSLDRRFTDSVEGFGSWARSMDLHCLIVRQSRRGCWMKVDLCESSICFVVLVVLEWGIVVPDLR